MMLGRFRRPVQWLAAFPALRSLAASCNLRDIGTHLCALPTREHYPKGLVCHISPDQTNPVLRSIVLITESIFPLNTCFARLSCGNERRCAVRDLILFADPW